MPEHSATGGSPARKATKKAAPKQPRPRKKSAREMFVDPQEMMIHLALEAVESRIRHRALVDTLRGGKAFSWQQYLDNFKIISERDQGPLLDAIILTHSAFASEHSEWFDADLKLYGLLQSSEEYSALGAVPTDPDEDSG
ncbi:MAG TPA: hypothetical protein VGC72_17765 [Candidatus Elarobacter sp.]|jgi:hypothetical protein